MRFEGPQSSAENMTGFLGLVTLNIDSMLQDIFWCHSHAQINNPGQPLFREDGM